MIINHSKFKPKLEINVNTLTSKVVTTFKSIAFVALFLSSSVFAQDAPKVAILDMATALFNSEIAKELAEAVEQETSDDQQKIRALAEEATALQERYQQDEAIMSDSDKRGLNEDLQEIGVNYQFLVEKVEKFIAERRQLFQQTYAPNLIQAINDVVEEEEYDIILRAEAVLFFETEFDITALVTAKLNQQ